MSSHHPLAGEGRTKTVERQRRLVTRGRTFVDRLCLRALSCDNVATMARQWWHYDGYQAAQRMALSLSVSFFVPPLGGEGRKDARRKNERNNGFIISGLYRRAAFHCSTSFLAVLPLSLSSPSLPEAWNLVETSRNSFVLRLSSPLPR